MQGTEVSEVLALVEKDGRIDLSGDLPSSAFKDELLDLVPADGDGAATAKKLVHALESLFIRQHLDGNLLIAVCVALKEISGMPMAKLVKKVDLARSHLKMPSPSWLAKNIKAARVVDAYPQLRDLGDIEKLCALDRLPEEALSVAVESGVLALDGKEVDLRHATRKEVAGAVREARGLSAKGKKEETSAEVSAKVADALARDDERHELLMAPTHDVVEPVRQVRGATVEAGPKSFEDRAKAVDYFLENYLGGDPSLVLGLQLAAAERVLSRLQGGIPDHPGLIELRAATGQTLALIQLAMEHLETNGDEVEGSWNVPRDVPVDI